MFQVEEQLQRLKAFYLTKVPPTGEDDAEVKYWSNSAERRWQLFLKKSFVTQDLGLEFLNLVNMVRTTLSEPMPFVGIFPQNQNRTFKSSTCPLIGPAGRGRSFQFHSH